MATYAAVLSLFHTLNHIKIHPRPPISLDQNQLDSLTQNLTFFQDFLERYPNSDSQEDDKLERYIAAASYAAEDIIETHIVDQIDHATSTNENISSVDLYGDLEKVIHDMGLIKREVMEIIQKKIMRAQHLDLHRISSVSTASMRQSSSKPVFDDAIFNQVLDKLTGRQSGLQIIPIVGMGGIGKTTFARNIYRKPLIVQYFDTLAWVTISQEYSRRNILQLLCQEVKGSINGLSEMSEDEVGLILYKHLCGRRYLIVIDDIWSVEAWDNVKSFFPDSNGSRIMITTRLSNLAFELSGSLIFQMQFLDEDKSWNLLCQIVFGKEDCPIELENIGKEIARKCRGLPLSIAVTGGLLKKSNMTQAYWIYILENLTMLINLEEDEYTLRILRTSYKELPMHLKPCFLYMRIFPEDYLINLSMLVQLWVAEGILKPIDGKSLEEVGKEYLKDLTDRNLILVPELRWDGRARYCKMHDLLRDVCLREALKQNFFCVVRPPKYYTPHDQVIDMERRICVVTDIDTGYSPDFLHALESASLARSLLYENAESFCNDEKEMSPSLRFRLLRVYSSVLKDHYAFTDSNNAIFKQANLRYISLKLFSAARRFFSMCSLSWNLQTLKVDKKYYPQPIILSEIWEMPLLRHVMFDEFALPDPPPNREDIFILENLQTLSRIINFKFSEEVIKRIPNIKKLKVTYYLNGIDDDEGLPTDFCLNNLDRLQKLESLDLGFSICDHCDVEKARRSLVSFPHSLKKLTLYGTRLNWEKLIIRLGSLPLLQLLRLQSQACVGSRWETTEELGEKLCNLRVLQISSCSDLKYWETDSVHFPRLEILRLDDLTK
ncbi:hypothetical protein ACS0TY_000195 [Phlomoides rotata]